VEGSNISGLLYIKSLPSYSPKTRKSWRCIFFVFTHFVSTGTNFYEVKTSLARLVFEISNLKFFITESKSSCPHLLQKKMYLRYCLRQIARWELILDRILRHLRQNKIHCNYFTGDQWHLRLIFDSNFHPSFQIRHQREKKNTTTVFVFCPTICFSE